MLKLSFRELLRLKSIVVKDQDDEVNKHLLNVISKEISQIPESLISIAMRTDNQDISICDERDIIRRLNTCKNRKSDNFSILICTPTTQIAEILVQRIVSLVGAKHVSKLRDFRLTLNNDVSIIVAPSNSTGLKGINVKECIVYSIDDYYQTAA